MITNIYVDGFNLYYRALKDTPFRWLDLRKLAETLFPEDAIHWVSYFTALLDARPDNPSQPQRQQAYLRALATLPGFEVSSGPHHQDSGEAKIRESTAGVSRKPSSDGKACGCSSKHLCGLTAWNT